MAGSQLRLGAPLSTNSRFKLNNCAKSWAFCLKPVGENSLSETTSESPLRSRVKSTQIAAQFGRSLIVLLSLSTAIAEAQEWNCQTPECVGHKAGYDWAANRPVSEQDCDSAGEHYSSPSFAEGCKTAIIAKQRFAAARVALMPLFQAYALGQQVAKESRALPSDCQSAYDAMTGPDASPKVDVVAAIGFKNGCLEVAEKQAKRIIKEDEKRAKEAAKQAKKQAQTSAH